METKTISNPPVTSLTLDGFDQEAMDAKVRSGFQRTQLASGRFSGQLLRASLRATRVDWGRYSLPLFATGQMPRETVILGLVYDFRVPGNLNGHSITTPTLVLLTEGAALDYQLPPYSQWFTFHLPRQLVEAAGMSLPDDYAAPLVTEPQQASWAVSRIACALETMHKISRRTPEIPNPEACLRDLESELLDVFSAITTGSSRSALRSAGHPAKSTRLVRKALEVVDARFDEPLSIGEICRELGCDWKRLERSFTTVTDVTPKRFLTLARLNRARQMLLRAAPDESVTSIASRCGMHHLGRFSQDYRSLFGEVPSATLRDSRKR